MSLNIKLSDGTLQKIAGNVISDAIRNPDWANAITLTSQQLTDGYTAPADGLIVGYYLSAEASNVIVGLRVNTKLVAAARGITSSAASDGNVQVQVNKGDTISFDGSTGSMSLKFIPYKVSSASDLVMGASTIRKGTATANILSNHRYTANIAFDSPMPDADYVININCAGWDGDGAIFGTPYHVINKTKNGFSIDGYCRETSTTSQLTFQYYAFKLYAVEDVEQLEIDVAALKAESTTTATPNPSYPLNINSVYKKGNSVQIQLHSYIEGDGTTRYNIPAGTVLATLPAGYRPKIPYEFTTNCWDAELHIIQMRVNTDGTVANLNGIGGDVLRRIDLYLSATFIAA